MAVFNLDITRRVALRTPLLKEALQSYRDPGDPYMVNALKRVYLLHIMPFPHRLEEYEKEYLEEYPLPTEISTAIEELVNKHGWKSFLYGLKVFIRRRVRMMSYSGYKRQLIPALLDKLDSLRTAVK